jgi:hypothetical protein
LILGATNRISRLEVAHTERTHGRSGYTPRKLARLAMSLLFDFSVMPLRLASVLGLILCALGAVILAEVLVETFWVGQRQIGWGSLMGALAVFSGAQLLMLGIIGEYVGRAFLTVSGKPQSLVRTDHSAMKGRRDPRDPLRDPAPCAVCGCTRCVMWWITSAAI